MDLAQDSIELINAALLNLGERSLVVDDAAHPASEYAPSMYKEETEFLQSIHSWKFAVDFVQLVKRDVLDEPFGVNTFAAPRGGEILAIYTSGDYGARPFTQYRIIDGYVSASADVLYAEVTTFAEIKKWPAYFRTLVIKALEAKFCITVTGDRLLARELKEQAFGLPNEYPYGGLCGVAATKDGQQEAGARLTLEDGPLVEARFGS